MLNLLFIPSPDVAAILHALLDIYERRNPPSLVMPEQLLCYNPNQPLIGDGDERADVISDSFLCPVRLSG
jgi:hypothetical protein